MKIEQIALFMSWNGNLGNLEVIFQANFTVCIQLLPSRHYKSRRIVGVWKLNYAINSELFDSLISNEISGVYRDSTNHNRCYKNRSRAWKFTHCETHCDSLHNMRSICPADIVFLPSLHRVNLKIWNMGNMADDTQANLFGR